MATIDESVNTVEQLRSDVQIIISDIADELNLKDCEIDFKKQVFTGDNFLGEIARVKIHPRNENNAFEPIHLIIKLAPQSTVTREGVPITSFYKNEILFYTNIVPIIEKLQDEQNLPLNECFLFPKFYRGILEEFKEFMVLRDLSHDGYILRDKKIPLDYEHAAMIVQNLARLHAASFFLKEKDPELFKKSSQNLPKTVIYGENFERMIAVLAGKVHSLITNETNKSKFKAFADSVAQNVHNYLDASLTEPYNVICHGDAWNNNILFKYEEEKLSNIVFIDYQLTRIASPVTDIAYALCLSTDLEVFEHRLKDFFKMYYDTLETSLSRMNCSIEKCYPKEVYKEQIKRRMGFGLLMGMCGIPMIYVDEGQPIHTTDDFINQLDEGTYGTNISDLAAKRLNGLVDIYIKTGFIL